MAFFGGSSTPVSRLEELRRLLQKDPASRQFLALAEEYRRHGKYRDAVITLERGLQIHTTSVAAHVALGRAYQQLDRLEDATRAFTNALRFDRENLVAIRQLAEVYLAKGDKLEAIKKLKLYRGLNSGDRDVNELIQKLEEEMSAAVAERVRSGVFAAVPDRAEAPRPSPFSSSVSRRAAMIPRLDRVSAAPPPPPLPQADPEILELTYDRPKRADAVETNLPAPTVPPPPPVRAESLLIETSPSVPLAPEKPAPSAPHPVVTSGVASTLVEKAAAPERIPLPEPGRGAEDDVPEESATVPFTFSLDPDGSRFATRSFLSPVETAPFDTSDEPPAAPPAAKPLVSETLADLYRAQGHVADARETYRALADSAADAARAESLREKAAALPPAARTDHARLRRLARRFPKREEATLDQLGGLLRDLVDRTEGIRAATLTDVEGIAVVAAGPSARDAATETLVAELSSFLKNVRRTTAETGAGELESFTLAGPIGAAVVSRVNAGYSLILQVDPDVALGEIRWEAARTARALAPAVR